MKIFYAVQATGNGHLSRAIELIPYLKKYGVVDVFLSGNNSQLKTDTEIRYRSKGLSLAYNKNGGLSYCNTLRNLEPTRLYKEAKELPVEDYDIILNDFESITSLACRMKKIHSLQFGHQASFMSPNIPRPRHHDPVGEFVLRNYAKCTGYFGLHFWPYDKNIVSPVLRKSILESKPETKDFIAIYLPQYSAAEILKKLQTFPRFQFVVHCKDVNAKTTYNHITLLPVDYELFAESLLTCRGLITGAGFETPSEALYLGKKLLVIPIKGQYEQMCNAEALREWDVPVLQHFENLTEKMIGIWLSNPLNQEFRLLFSTSEIVDRAIQTALALRK